MSVFSILTAYQAATTLAAPLMPAWLRWRVGQGKELADRLSERYGQTSAPRPSGPLIWCHAASVGETISILPLITALTQRGFAVLLTTGTVASERIVRDRLPPRALHQFAALDHRAWVQRFLNHWRPDLALRVDSEIWPNTLTLLRAMNVPVIQINARMSAPAYDNWRAVTGFARDIFGAIDLVCAQSDDDRQRYAMLGAKMAHVSGNLKLAQTPLPFDASALAALKADVGARPVWIAASIHPGEDAVVGHAHRVIKTQHPHLLTVVVPRHPERAAAMIQCFQNLGLHVAQRSLKQPITANTDIYLADTMGELGVLYRLCPIVFVGKSFTVGGGQNPAEPAQIGCALVWGPDMSNFADISHDLETKGAALGLAAPAALGATISGLIAEPARAAHMAEAGKAYVAANNQALSRTLDLIAPYLDRHSIS